MKKITSAQIRALAILITAVLCAAILLPFGWPDDTALAVSKTTTLYATKDKFVDNTGGYDNWSSAEGKTLYVGQFTALGYGDAQSAVCFNLSSISGDITNAKLRIYVKYVYASPALTIYGSNQDDWAETGTVVPTKDVTVLSGASVGTSWREYDVTSFIQDESAGDDVATLVLHIADNSRDNDFYFTSSEDANKPQLVVSYNQAAAVLSGTLTESNVNGASVNIALDDETFADATLAASNFTINGAPFTVSGVHYTDATHCTLTLAYGGDDFDTNKSLSVSIAGAELSGGSNLTTNIISATATNDAETLSLSGSATEGAENGTVINVTLSGGQFADTITPGNWTVSNLPEGVAKGTVTRVNDTHVNITLSGNAMADYDVNITDVTVSCTGNEYLDSTGGGSISRSTGVTLTATNDAEGFSISDDGSIAEGAEDGEVISVLLSGGQFADTLTPANWAVENLPGGVSKGAVARVDDTHVTITLSGNATADYDADIINVTVSCTDAEYIDSTGGGSLSADSGVELTAETEPEVQLEASPVLTESNIDGATANITLVNMTFADATLDASNFTVSGASFTVSGVSYTDDTHGTLTLAYGGDDFDTNQSFGVSIAGAELSTGSSTTSNTISVTATNDAESLALSGSATEGAEDGAVINAAISGGQFADTITPGNWTVSNLPEGVAKGTVTRVDDTHVNITLSGNTTEDYDVNITDVTVSCTGDEYSDSTGGTSISGDSGVTLTATDDDESLALSGSATEGAEDGTVINAAISGGQFADTITPGNWTVENLPEGVAKGTVTRVDDTHVNITLSGNTTEDYDVNITDVTVSCTGDEYSDSTGGTSISGDSGVTLTATDDDESLALSGSATEGAEDGTVINAAISGGQFADTLTPGNWTVSNLPEGVAKGTVTRVDDTHVNITLSGNATEDYDVNIANVTVLCTGDEYLDSTGDGSLSGDSGVTLTATNDDESLALSGSATEGAEDGTVINAAISGGQFADTITPGNWTVSNLPEGVAKGTVTRVDDTHVNITLSGNATEDYDSDITNVTVSCTGDEYVDSTGDGSLSGDSGITLTAVVEPEVILSTPVALDESGIDGATVDIRIKGMTFADAMLDKANFTIDAPFTVAGVSYADATHGTLTVAYSGTDFDSTQHLSMTVAGSELSTGITIQSNTLDVAATDDVERLAISDDGLMIEGAESGEVIAVNLVGGTFANILNPAHWTVHNLPRGVVMGTVARVDDTHVNITLSGNATADYDSDITDVMVSCTADQYDDNTGGTSLAASGVTLRALNDPESLAMTDDGEITEGAESGEVVTVTLTGGQFAASLDPAKWTVANLPAGVSKGSVTRVDAHTVRITLQGNATADYDSDITNVAVTCAAGQYISGTQPLTVASGVVLTATVEPTPTAQATSTPQPTPTVQPTLPTSTPQPTPTAQPTSTPQPTPTAQATSTPQPTQNGSEQTITGTLLDSNGTPMAGYIVELHSDPVSTITDEKGHYTFHNVAYTDHTLIVKTPENEEIASFVLLFAPGEEFDTATTDESMSITYTHSTVSVNITVTVAEDKGSAVISEVSSVNESETAGSSVWWIWVLAGIIAGLAVIVMIWFRRMRTGTK